MISRVADHCFWFGRYLERAESTARLLATTHNLALDAELEPAQCWRPVIVVAGEEDHYRTRVVEGAPDGEGLGEAAWGDGERVERFMTWAEDSGTSIRASVRGARWNARSIREVVSLEAWEAVNELHLWLAGDASDAEWRTERHEFYKRVRSLT